jgi:NAD(P)-dependent dehydrogenase (short-subunit alcohol dehydrogenase family)
MDSPAAMLDFSGKAVVITGAAGGIGAGIARRFSAAGASLVAHTKSSSLAPLESDLSGPFATVQADLTSPEGPEAVVDAAFATYGRLDVLVNNAAVQPLVTLNKMTDAEWTEMIATNLTAVHRLTQAVASRMRQQGDGGAIVHISSIEGSQPAPGHGHYAVSKAALIMHARAAAQEYGDAGIRVNSLSPGLIDRPGLAQDWPEGVARWQAAAPLRRLGTPADVADACMFLCSDLARWITGANLVVDGGVLTRPTW